MTHQYRFGDVVIDQQSFRLFQAGKPLAIEPKALNVLIFLVQHQGRLVERRELLSAVWGDAFVTDHVLNRSIGQLRKVLGDDSKEPRYIETVPTLGYRFIAVVATEPLETTLAVPDGSRLDAAIESLRHPLATGPASPNKTVQLELIDALPTEAVPTAAAPTLRIAREKRSGQRTSRLAFYGVGIGLAAVAVEAVSFF